MKQKFNNLKKNNLNILKNVECNILKGKDANIITYNEKNTGRKYVVEFKNSIDISISILQDIYFKIKEKVSKGFVLLMTGVMLLSSCSQNGIPLDYYEKTKEIYGEEVKKIKLYQDGYVNYISSFNNFSESVYSNKKTSFLTVPEEYYKYIDNKGNLLINDIINDSKINKDLYSVDWTIFSKGYLYEINKFGTGSNINGDFGENYIKNMENIFGENYQRLKFNDILNKKIFMISNFYNNGLYNGGINDENLAILESYKKVVGDFDKSGYKLITLEDLFNINADILKNKKILNKTLNDKVLYSNYILGNILFLLLNTPSEIIEDMESNKTFFEIGYGDNNYININGNFNYNQKAEIIFDEKFNKDINILNKKLKEKGVEIILDEYGIILIEKGMSVVPGDYFSTKKFLNENINSDLKQILINESFLHLYLTNNYDKNTEKKHEKDFFVKNIKTLLNKFKQDFNLNNNELENLIKYGNINGNNNSEIDIYGIKVNNITEYKNIYNIDFFQQIFINIPSFYTLNHEFSHMLHVKYINENINNNSYNFLYSINNYPYVGNYKNDQIFKYIYNELILKSYRSEIGSKELELFSYYSLYSLNYYEIIAEISSNVLSYPNYLEYSKENGKNQMFLNIAEKIKNNIIKDTIN